MKEKLAKIIKNEGCYNVHCHECVFCNLVTFFCNLTEDDNNLIYRVAYNAALKKFIEEYGEEELMGILL